MSDEYWDAVCFRKTKGGKTMADRYGSAKKREDGGFNIWLNGMPASKDGQYEIQIVPQRQKPPAGQGAATKNPADLDDEIPF
jgi:hypothetical protein